MKVPSSGAHCRGSVRRPRESCGIRSVVAVGGFQLHSSEGGAFLSSFWGWASGSVCAVGAASGNQLCVRL